MLPARVAKINFHISGLSLNACRPAGLPACLYIGFIHIRFIYRRRRF